MAKETYSGINIQYPISREIISGEKVIETRTYPLPNKFLNEEMLLIETPGKKGNFKARIVAIIKFTACHKYQNENEFYKDYNKHKVDKSSEWRWGEKPKFGWTVHVIKRFTTPVLIPPKIKRGILYTNNIPLS